MRENLKKSITWETEISHSMRRTIWWQRMAMIGMVLVIVVLITTVKALSEMTEVIGVPVVVERNTGKVEVMSHLHEVMNQSEREAVVISLLTQFIQAWKTYDYSDARERATFIQMLADRPVFTQYREMYRLQNDENPNVYFQPDDTATATIISVSKLNDQTYSIRLRVEEDRGMASGSKERYFVSIIKYKLADLDMSQQDRWVNPLGLLVTSVRFDEEFFIR